MLKPKFIPRKDRKKKQKNNTTTAAPAPIPILNLTMIAENKSHIGRFHHYFTKAYIKNNKHNENEDYNGNICKNDKPKKCTTRHHICHYMTPHYMESLTSRVKLKYPLRYYDTSYIP